MSIEIIEQGHEIELMSTAITIMHLLENAGRTCYKSEPKGDPDGFVRKIIKSGHLSVIEHANASVRFITDRSVSLEMVRHRLASYSQESQRYVKYNEGIEFIKPVNFDSWALSIQNTFLESLQIAANKYQDLIRLGLHQQEARGVLPNATKTEIVMTCNLREWRHVFQMRCQKAAHPQIRGLMLPLLAEFKEKLPAVFDDLDY